MDCVECAFCMGSAQGAHRVHIVSARGQHDTCTLLFPIFIDQMIIN